MIVDGEKQKMIVDHLLIMTSQISYQLNLSAC